MWPLLLQLRQTKKAHCTETRVGLGLSCSNSKSKPCTGSSNCSCNQIQKGSYNQSPAQRICVFMCFCASLRLCRYVIRYPRSFSKPTSRQTDRQTSTRTSACTYMHACACARTTIRKHARPRKARPHHTCTRARHVLYMRGGNQIKDEHI